MRALVAGANQAHLATLLPDGSPLSVPVRVDLEGEYVALPTSPGSRKARNMERDPRVAVSLTEAGNPGRLAQTLGTVVKLSRRRIGAGDIDRTSYKYTAAPDPVRTDRIVYLIEPERALAPTVS